MCSTMEGVQHGGGCSVQWRYTISTVEGYHQDSGEIPLVKWRIFSTVECYHKYSGGGCSVRWRDIISTVGDFPYFCTSPSFLHLVITRNSKI